MFGSRQLDNAFNLYLYGGPAELICELAENVPSYGRRNAMLRRVRNDIEVAEYQSKVSER